MLLEHLYTRSAVGRNFNERLFHFPTCNGEGRVSEHVERQAGESQRLFKFVQERIDLLQKGVPLDIMLLETHRLPKVPVILIHGKREHIAFGGAAFVLYRYRQRFLIQRRLRDHSGMMLQFFRHVLNELHTARSVVDIFVA